MIVDEQERAARRERAHELVASLTAQGVAAVALTYVDTSGLTRVKGVPVARLEDAAAWGVGMSPVFDAFLVDDSIARGRYAGGPVGDLRLLPDLDRVVALAAQPGWAWAPVDRWTQDGDRHPMCSRSFAASQVERLTTLGYELRMGFEVEWYVDAGQGTDLAPACTGPAYGMRRVIELSDYCRDLLNALARQGVAVQQLHPEYASGQLELSVAAEDPVGAADTTALVRATILAISAARGLRVSFAPMVVAGHVGNGGHVHLSVWRESRNLMSESYRRLSAEGEAFSAGVLAELPALLAVGAPSVSSYLRLVPQRWAGAFQCWGWENREAAMRMISGPAGSETVSGNVEIKCFDQSANPYLVVGAVTAAGLGGLIRSEQLPPAVDIDPASLDDGERLSRGIRRLPERLEDSVDAFLSSAALTQAMGEQLVDTIATVRRAEIDLFSGKKADEIIAATRWRY